MSNYIERKHELLKVPDVGLKNRFAMHGLCNDVRRRHAGSALRTGYLNMGSKCS